MRRLSPLVALLLLLAGGARAQDSAHVVVVATTDVHGRVYHWDYVRDEEAPWGLTRAATVLDSLRRRYPGRVVLVDAGDLIQGDPFAAFFATERALDPHPVIDALNAVRYDAATLGNHEFNWGLEVLDRAIGSAAYPIVSGNIFRLDPTSRHLLPPFTILQRGAVRVGVTGFTTPGVMVWDWERVRDRVDVARILPQATAVLREMASGGADLRVALIHSGLGGPSSYDTTNIGAENVAAQLAALPVKPHVVVLGHSHRTIVDSVISGVHFMQAPPYARGLAIAHVWLARRIGGSADRRIDSSAWDVVRVRGEQLSLAAVPPDPATTRRLTAAHRAVQVWVGEPLARISGAWSAQFARVEDTPIIDFVNEVQRRVTGAQLSSTAAFNPGAAFGPNEVYLRDLAGVYPYENTLKAIRITGAQLKAYLEQSSAYFKTYWAGLVQINDSVPGYDFDIVSGIDYVLDLTYPVGSRVRRLTYEGTLVQPTDEFTMAVNNYRQGGGGGFAMLAGAPVVYDRGENIRDLLVEYVRRLDLLHDTDYFVPSWRIVPPEAAEAARQNFERGGRP